MIRCLNRIYYDKYILPLFSVTSFIEMLFTFQIRELSNMSN